MQRALVDLASIGSVALLLCSTAAAFESGSTGADGDFSPSVSTEVVLPSSGILNYRSVNVPSGVTVTFKRNTTNTPVVILVQNDATIAGTIALDGSGSTATGRAGDGNLLDDGQPGLGGPGGFDGGYGGQPGRGRVGGNGLGPGGGGGGRLGAYGFGSVEQYPAPSCGGGAGFAQNGGAGPGANRASQAAPGGSAYGSDSLIPLAGGSGGGGGASGARFRGSGGGGGGGAMLLAATGAVNLSGLISARGGGSGAADHLDGDVAAGGAGSGGAIRIVATRVLGNGQVNVQGTIGGRANYLGTPWGSDGCSGGAGSAGRVRIEAETTSFQGSTPDVTASIGTPGPVFLTSAPSLRFISVAGLPVPTNPTGVDDVTIPAGMPDEVPVVVATSNIPVGTIIKVRMVPRAGAVVDLDSPPTIGATDNASTSVNVSLPAGRATLQASVSYMVVASIGDGLARFAEGERVEKITLSSALGGANQATLHTVSGREFPIEPALLALAALPH
mgnify:CR=1 FL=1